MIKTFPCTSNYSLIALFSFFQSKKMFLSLTVVSSISFPTLRRFLTSLIVVPSISFFNLKSFLTYSIMFSSTFYLSHHYVLKKKDYFLKENKCLLYSLKGFEKLWWF